MKDIVFNEGGMPLALDDLQLLADRPIDIVAPFINEIIKGHEVVFIKKPIVEDVVNKDKTMGIEISNGSVWFYNRIVSWHDTTLQFNSSNRAIYLCFKEVENEPRVFENAQTYNTRKELVAYFSTNKEGASDAYELNKIATFIECLKEAINSVDSNEWEDVTIETWHNGYSGTLKWSEKGGHGFIKANISSNNIAWDEDKTGQICTIDDVFFKSHNMPGRFYTQLYKSYNQELSIYLAIDGRNFMLLASEQGKTISPKDLPINIEKLDVT